MDRRSALRPLGPGGASPAGLARECLGSSVGSSPVGRGPWSSAWTAVVGRAGVLAVCVALALPALAPSGVQSAPGAQGPSSEQAAPAWQVLGEGAELRSPAGVAVDVAGNVYVADSGNHRVVRLSPEGRQAAAWGSQGAAPGQFDDPSGVAVDGAGYVYVADTFNQRIQKLTPNGQPVLIVGEPGTGPGQFRDPSGIAADAEGTMYVADTHNDRVQKLTPDGYAVAAWGDPNQAALDADADADADAEPDMAPRGRAFDELREPRGIAADLYGRLIVADTNNGRLVTLSAESGQLLDLWGVPGGVAGADPSAGAFWSPRGVAVDYYGQVYVADTYNHRVRLLAADGTPLAQWGAEGGAPGEFRFPSGLALDPSGALYVADTGNHRIQRLPPAPR